MDIHLELVGDVAMAEVIADALDVSNAEDLKSRLRALADDHKKLVLDLYQVAFLDSAGCGALVTSMSHFRATGGDLRLCCLAQRVRTLVELVRLNRVLGIHDTREAAIAAFRA